MPSPTEIVAALKDYRIKVVEDQGWKTRGAKDHNSQLRPFHPYGQAVHHDALSEAVSDAAALRIMREGRIDLSGPLCNGWIDSNSVVYLIAAGNANHAGWNERDVHDRLSKGLAPLGDARNDPDKDGIVGNSFLWGWECRNAGDGRDPWEQLDAMERSCAALADVYGWKTAAIAGHRELTARKIDPAGIDMHQFRTDVKRIYEAHQGPPPTIGSEEIDMLLVTQKSTGNLWLFESSGGAQGKGRRTLIRDTDDKKAALASSVPHFPAEDALFENLIRDRDKYQ